MLIDFILIEHPLLAVVPGVAYITAHVISRQRMALIAGLGWVAYAVWELMIKRRILCSGECSVRVDLLLIYPGLAFVSIAAIVAIVRSRRRADG